MAWSRSLSKAITAPTIDEGECVASVLLAILIAHLLGPTHISWAAFAGYMVMRGHAAETPMRGVLAQGAILPIAISARNSPSRCW